MHVLHGVHNDFIPSFKYPIIGIAKHERGNKIVMVKRKKKLSVGHITNIGILNVTIMEKIVPLMCNKMKACIEKSKMNTRETKVQNNS